MKYKKVDWWSKLQNIRNASTDLPLCNINFNVYEGFHRNCRAIRRKNSHRCQCDTTLQLFGFIDCNEADIPTLSKRCDHIWYTIADGYVSKNPRLSTSTDDLVHNDIGTAVLIANGWWAFSNWFLESCQNVLKEVRQPSHFFSDCVQRKRSSSHFIEIRDTR